MSPRPDHDVRPGGADAVERVIGGCPHSRTAPDRCGQPHLGLSSGRCTQSEYGRTRPAAAPRIHPRLILFPGIGGQS